MKIIRWLLSHAFLILVIVAVIYGYMFWGNLAGKDTPAGKAIAYLSDEFVVVKEFVDAVKAKQAKLQGESASSNSEQVSAVTDPATPAAEQAGSTAVAGSDHGSTRVEQTSEGYAIHEEAVSQDETAVVNSGRMMQGNDESPAVEQSQLADSGGQQYAGAAAAVTESKEVFVSPDIEQQLSHVDQSGKVIKETEQGGSVRATWIMARKAFYQRNYELSEQSYLKVIDSTEDNFDAYGELGNVYFNQGKNEQAASAYLEAASILVRKGQVRRARSLMGLLRHLDKSKADELQKLIDSNLS